MTAEERIAALEKITDAVIEDHAKAKGPMPAEIAVACEIRALRFTLRDEIREAAWRVSTMMPDQLVTRSEEALASRTPPRGGAGSSLEDKP
jgi:hypothetical protein